MSPGQFEEGGGGEGELRTFPGRSAGMSRSSFTRLAVPFAADPAADLLRRSYSGHGEDAYVLSWLTIEGRLRPEEIRYVDVGAAHPFALSNTYLMYSLGGSGVLIDPDPDHVAHLSDARPRDTAILAGVAFDERHQGTLIRFQTPVFNTFSEEQAAKVVAASKTWG